ncbi:hypothetical protein [Kaistella carnis]|uniref:hypothetical protein n=1 Tax=Kaistella carnis TaxID=1241979 RepID=UPI0028AD6DC2|nr:hypothetical protein [Kaistella carnis]
MDKSMIETKNDLIEWIENTYDLEILQKIADLKNRVESSSLLSDTDTDTDTDSEKIIENNFDEQFAAGMTSEELLENIATHLKSIDSEEPSSVVSDIEAKYAVKDDFDERFTKGLTPAESRQRTREFISNLPWKK